MELGIPSLPPRLEHALHSSRSCLKLVEKGEHILSNRIYEEGSKSRASVYTAI